MCAAISRHRAPALIDLATVRLAIVCPMANEGAEAVRFVDSVLAKAPGFGDVKFFAILDEVTKDGSLELLREHSSREERLHVVWAPENTCVVDAYVRGYRAALASGADWILEIDAGFSHDPDDIPKFWSAMQRGCDCVFSTRFTLGGRIQHSSLKRYWMSRGGTILSNVLLGTKFGDMTSGFELFSRDALQMVLNRGIHSRAHFFQTEIRTYCRNLRVAEAPITYRMASPRLRNSAIVEALAQLLRLFYLRLVGRL